MTNSALPGVCSHCVSALHQTSSKPNSNYGTILVPENDDLEKASSENYPDCLSGVPRSCAHRRGMACITRRVLLSWQSISHHDSKKLWTVAKVFLAVAAFALITTYCITTLPTFRLNAPTFAQGTTNPSNTTVANDELQTWWHSTGEINTQTAVQNGNVRQSRMYNIQVSTVGSGKWFDSFVYESIPRNGNGQIGFPGGPVDESTEDGVSIEPDVGINMAWTQFLYASDVVVKVTRKDGNIPSASDVVIRPTTLDYSVESYSGSIYITVPFSKRSSKFSIEFQDDLWEYHAETFPHGTRYVQDVNPSGVNYVSSYENSSLISVEPKNALLVFASPFAPEDLVASATAQETYVVPQGLVTGLETITQSTVYFGPGVYWFTGTNHAKLSSSVDWVHLAPGAFVKGAVQYSSSNPTLKATGFGVLSGEQYVYQCNPPLDYINSKSDITSLRMWSGIANAGQKFILQGPTITAPPFNTMDFYGDLEHFTSEVFDYKQTGAFFWQTDGIEVYPNSHVSDIFYHTNDDTVKAYYSNVLIERVINWKINNDPVIQLGWYPRNLTNITVADLTVIHARYHRDDAVVVSALIGEAPSYLDTVATNGAFTTWDVTNFTVNNLRCEGICPSLIRLNPLQSFDNFTIDGAYIESYSPASTGIGESFIKAFTDVSGVAIQIGAHSQNGIGLTIKDYFVGGTKVTLEADNWQAGRVGQLNFDDSYWGHWTVI